MRPYIPILIGAFYVSIILCQESPLLYSSNDTVVNLGSDNFAQIVYDKNSMWLIKFYLHWCNHCIQYSKLWKQFSREVKIWLPYIKVGAVNCGDKKNDKICNHYGIVKYPQLLMFYPNSNAYNQPFEVPLQYDLTDLKNYALKQLAYISTLEVAHNWPNLNPLFGDKYSMDNLFAQLSENKSVIILQRPDNTLGVRIILEARNKLGDSVSFLIPAVELLDAGLIAKHTQLTSQDKESLTVGLRSLQAASRGRRFITSSLVPPTVAILVRLGRQRNNFLITDATSYNIKNVIDKLALRGLTKDRDNGVTKASLTTPTHVLTTSDDPSETLIKTLAAQRGHYNCVFVEDLENGLYTALSQEVLRHRTFDYQSTEALLYFLNVTSLFYPVYDNARINNFLYRLSLYVISQGSSLTSDKLEAFMEKEAYSTKIFPEANRRWINCRGSSPEFRGYTCGLWTLFHTLTVRALEDATKQGPGSSTNNGFHTLRSIRGYVRHFFGCQECTNHFLNMSAHLDADLNSIARSLIKPNSRDGLRRNTAFEAAAPLWLWSRHNRVNQRLSNQTTTLDPAAPKIQFPPEALCRGCRPGPPDPFNGWDVKKVLHFLTSYYGQPSNNPYNRNDIYIPHLSGPGDRRCAKIPF